MIWYTGRLGLQSESEGNTCKGNNHEVTSIPLENREGSADASEDHCNTVRVLEGSSISNGTAPVCKHLEPWSVSTHRRRFLSHNQIPVRLLVPRLIGPLQKPTCGTRTVQPTGASLYLPHAFAPVWQGLNVLRLIGHSSFPYLAQCS